MDVKADPVGVQKRTVSHFKVLNRPLKWDTVCLWTPTGFKNTSRQSWTFEKNLHFSTKTNVFSNVQLWRLLFLNPVGVQRRAVSHFKGLFKTFKMRYSTFLYSYWIGLHVHFKKAILHLKRANMPFFLSVCVCLAVHDLFCNRTVRLIEIFGNSSHLYVK